MSQSKTDYYEVLQVSPNAEADTIHRNFSERAWLGRIRSRLPARAARTYAGMLARAIPVVLMAWS